MNDVFKACFKLSSFCWAVVSSVNFDFSMDKTEFGHSPIQTVEGEQVLLQLVNGPFNLYIKCFQKFVYIVVTGVVVPELWKLQGGHS